MIGLAFLGVVAGHSPHGDLRQMGRKDPGPEPPSRLVATGLGRSSAPARTYEEPSFPTSLPRLPEDAEPEPQLQWVVVTGAWMVR